MFTQPWMGELCCSCSCSQRQLLLCPGQTRTGSRCQHKMALELPQEHSPSLCTAMPPGAWGGGTGRPVHSWGRKCPVVPLESQLAPAATCAGRLSRGLWLSWHRGKLLFPHCGWPFHLRAITLELPTWGIPAWHINGRLSWVAFQSAFGCFHAFVI